MFTFLYNYSLLFHQISPILGIKNKGLEVVKISPNPSTSSFKNIQIRSIKSSFLFPFKYLYKLVYILLYWHANKIWDYDQSQLKINILRKCYNTYCIVLLIYSTGTVAIVHKFIYLLFIFSIIGLCFFFFFYKYLCKLIYCYTNTTNFTILS